MGEKCCKGWEMLKCWFASFAFGRTKGLARGNKNDRRFFRDSEGKPNNGSMIVACTQSKRSKNPQ